MIEIRTDHRVAFGLLPACLALGLSGCILGNTDDEPMDETPIGAQQPVLSPPIIHSGFDGSNTFLIPINTDLERYADGEISWEIDDETIATIAPVQAPPFPGSFGARWALIETRAAGRTTVHAVIGDRRVSADLVVTDYDAADFPIGEARYNDPAGAGPAVSCASCHLIAGGADHTPTEMGFHDDAAILEATISGRYPDQCLDQARRPCECDSEGCELVAGLVLNGGDHSWTLTAEEQKGIIPYLRALAPNGFEPL